MRTARDRILHAISFEIIGLALVTPLGAWAFGLPMHDIGVVGIVGATVATLWNYAYNLLFDHAMLRLVGTVRKTLPARVLHTVLFEAGLLAILLPFIAWYLGVTLVQAFLMDVSFALFYLVYAFVFNWAFDLAFPVPSSPPSP
ncbi:PACE efflux transporter [Defluviimonas sp. WL0024]|uniref:PACE efflux transporter n=2 Tax=Albidovulum TaxID=205889 RepID=A0ABT3IZD8_9RHOB|nr:MULTISPECIES: PACE efflux transporter [Defluviimonas]MCU9849701.1 PACE efflux transporter [Defluviimonas sp. WL0024]MCW3780788.1 PACE efflux transporter [Defluviimonas salinarum]